jgi:nucleotidyltransferase/DNA polymerase involved in DNA repair
MHAQIIPRGAVPLVMACLPLASVRGLGGQLGEQVSTTLGISFAAELLHVPHAQLVSHFGQQLATWLAAVAVGGLDEPVVPSSAPKSLNAVKSFPACSDDATIRRASTALRARRRARRRRAPPVGSSLCVCRELPLRVRRLDACAGG